MFVESGGGWERPWEPPRRKPRLTKRQEDVILWIVVVNALLLLLAPIGGATIIEAVVAVWTGG